MLIMFYFVNSRGERVFRCLLITHSKPGYESICNIFTLKTIIVCVQGHVFIPW